MTVKVLQVLPRVGRQGGAERSMLEMATGLRAADIELSAAWFFDRREDVLADLHALGVRTHHVDAPRLPGRIRQLRRLIRDTRPDIVHTVVWEADVAGRLAAAGLPVQVMSSVVNTTYEPVRRRDGDVSRLGLTSVRAIDGLTLRFLVDRVHANSESVRDSVVRRLHVPPDRISVVRRGRSRDRLGEPGAERRAAARQHLGLGPDDRLVLAVGRQVFQKGHRHLIAAAPVLRSVHPTAQVWVAGEPGARSAELRSQVAELGLGDVVHLLGARDDVPDLLAAADVFAFPTLYEGLPGAVIEAMAMEVPIVASAIGPVTELVDPSTAVLVPPGDAAALATALIGVLDDPDAARVRAVRARARFEDGLTVERSLEAMVALYRDVHSAAADHQGA